MERIYSYVLRYDEGAAPNPFWGVCTLTICKPAIRRTAKVGDWVIGTGSKKSKINNGNTYDFTGKIVYAMKVTKILSLKDYDEFCREELPNKIPNWNAKDWKKRIGDCIYDYSIGDKPTIRKSVHNELNRERDLSGLNSLLSTHFYYFGEKPQPLPNNLNRLIKKSQGHLKIEVPELIENFEHWISQFEKNRIYANPQLKHEFDKGLSEEQISKCSTRHKKDDSDEKEKIIC